jgi:hypothetical protein
MMAALILIVVLMTAVTTLMTALPPQPVTPLSQVRLRIATMMTHAQGLATDLTATIAVVPAAQALLPPSLMGILDRSISPPQISGQQVAPLKKVYQFGRAE